MANENSVPANIASMVAALNDKSNPDHVRFNNYNNLFAISSYVGRAIAAYEKERGMKVVQSNKGKR